MNKNICSRCVYDADVPGIIFNSHNICNYCEQQDLLEKEFPLNQEGNLKLKKLISEIKKSGKGKKYDCVLGVSGGCDSSFLLYKLVSWGIRPLAVHYDNTWNSNIATDNINKILKGLNVDLFTLVMNHEEIDDIFKSFIKAGVAEVDSATDIALVVALYKAANKYKIKYMVEGHSFRVEGVSPIGWSYIDGKFIHDVHKNYGTLKMKKFPNLWFSTFLKNMLLNRVKRVRPLYYIDYNKEKAKKILNEKFDWQWYGGHHLENRFTAFGHNYVNPFYGNDQRSNSFSALVRSGQMKRSEALKIMNEKVVCNPDLLEYVLERLEMTKEELDNYLSQKRKTFKDFKTYKKTFEKLRPFFYLAYKAELVPKSFYLKYCFEIK